MHTSSSSSTTSASCATSVTVGRFAPSPTGHFHLGNLRTALLAWLFARLDQGRFVLRFEDLDPRSRKEFYSAQLRELESIGIDWDGDILYQSKNLDRYEAVLRDLAQRNLVFECYCSRRELLEAASAPHAKPGVYPGTCRKLSKEVRCAKRKAFAAQHRLPACRLKAIVPQDFKISNHTDSSANTDGATGTDIFTRTHYSAKNRGPAKTEAYAKSARHIKAGEAVKTGSFTDGLYGEQEADIDDFVLRRTDGVFAYNLVCVVDDADQGVNQIVRGHDLISSTPRQNFLHALLHTPVPQYLHVPMLLNQDGIRLAKRDGAVTLEQLAELGWHSSDVVELLVDTLGIDALKGARSAGELLEGAKNAGLKPSDFPTTDRRLDINKLTAAGTVADESYQSRPDDL